MVEVCRSPPGRQGCQSGNGGSDPVDHGGRWRGRRAWQGRRCRRDTVSGPWHRVRLSHGRSCHCCRLRVWLHHGWRARLYKVLLRRSLNHSDRMPMPLPPMHSCPPLRLYTPAKPPRAPRASEETLVSLRHIIENQNDSEETPPSPSFMHLDAGSPVCPDPSRSRHWQPLISIPQNVHATQNSSAGIIHSFQSNPAVSIDEKIPVVSEEYQVCPVIHQTRPLCPHCCRPVKD